MDTFSLIVSAFLQLGLLGAIVIYSLRQMKRLGGFNVITVVCSLCTASVVVVALFICTGAFLERFLSRDRIVDAGVVATATMAGATLMSGCAALVCLLRRSVGWRMVFILQTLTCLYLGLITMHVAMGKPFSSPHRGLT
jgi:hypothetical protein